MKSKANGFGPSGPDEGEVQRLIEDAGPRASIQQEDIDEIKAAAHEVWRGRVRSRRTSIVRSYAIAAAILIAVIGGVFVTMRIVETNGSQVVARCAQVKGAVVVAGHGGEVPVTEGWEFRDGDEVRVSDGLVALEIGQGVSVRLASATRVKLGSATQIELLGGVVYVDTGAHGGSIEVVTPLGTARDIGTQFQVRVDESTSTLSVTVREGEVVVRRRGEEHSVLHGTGLILSADGAIEREEAPAFGSAWRWVLDAAPRFEIEGRTLEEYLAWVARETGLQVRYAEPALAGVAADTTLHGSTGELRADEAALVVLPGAGLEGEIVDGSLEVRRRE